MQHYVTNTTARRVCVIGAGVSGLATAKVLVHAGHDVTIFERDTDVGGVWTKTRAYPGLTTQTPGMQYAFTDFPAPPDHRGWPSAQRIVEYLRCYAAHFDIARLIRCGQQVVDVRRPPTGGEGWSVTVVDDSAARSEHRFDFVVMCNGTFHTPKPISVPGVQRFSEAGGTVLHSSECNDPGVLTGKRVVVVGFGKSATDIACYAADRAKSVHLVVRRPVWPVPKVLGGVLSVRWMCTSRLWEWLMPHRPPQRWVARRMHRATPVLWRAIEAVLARQFHLDRCGLRPPHGFADQVTTGFLLSPDRLYDLLMAGRIYCVCGTPDHFTEQGVTLSGDVHLDADVVVLGIGYQQALPFLDSSVRARVIDSQGRFRLYRHLVNPDVPDLGFVGYNNSLFTPVTSEVGARWLAAYLANRLDLPDAPTLHREIDVQLDVGARARPLIGKFTGVNVAPYTYDHLDTLLRDLGETTTVSGLNRLWTFIKPFDPADFAPEHPPVTPPRRRSPNLWHGNKNREDSMSTDATGLFADVSLKHALEDFWPLDTTPWAEVEVETLLWEQYQRTVDDEDELGGPLTVRPDAVVRWVSSTLDLPAVAVVLDIGCGAGLYSQRLAQEGHYVTGIDVNDSFLDHAARRAAAVGVPCVYRNQSVFDLDATAEFDLVLATQGPTLQLPAAQLHGFVVRLARALRPGGHLLCEFSLTPSDLHARPAVTTTCAKTPAGSFLLGKPLNVQMTRELVFAEAGERVNHRLFRCQDGTVVQCWSRFPLHSLETLHRVLREAGLRVRGTYGPQVGAPLRPDHLTCHIWATASKRERGKG